jgi:hypothetical protein
LNGTDKERKVQTYSVVFDEQQQGYVERSEQGGAESGECANDFASREPILVLAATTTASEQIQVKDGGSEDCTVHFRVCGGPGVEYLLCPVRCQVTFPNLLETDCSDHSSVRNVKVVLPALQER